MAHNHMADDGNSEEAPDPLTTFNEYRSLLFSIAYRMLGTVADAEDMLQDAFIRWQEAPRDAVHLSSGGAQHTSVSLRQDNNLTDEARERAERNWGVMLAGLKHFVEHKRPTIDTELD